MEVLLRLQVFGNVTLCGSVSVFRYFEQSCRLHLQGKVLEEVLAFLALEDDDAESVIY
jgi:hypothetical protein